MQMNKNAFVDNFFIQFDVICLIIFSSVCIFAV